MTKSCNIIDAQISTYKPKAKSQKPKAKSPTNNSQIILIKIVYEYLQIKIVVI
jgi:hypothetical protein